MFVEIADCLLHFRSRRFPYSGTFVEDAVDGRLAQSRLLVSRTL